MERCYVGIDGCRQGWMYSAIRQHQVIEVGFSNRITKIWNRFHNSPLILIDIPIGLSNTKTRGCDVEARKFLKPSSGSCVFPAPCREALQAKSYKEACAENKRITGNKISRQTWNIVPKIREGDDFLRAIPEARKKVRESHPEICFRALSEKPVGSSKKTPEGTLLRLGILKRHLDNIEEHVLDAAIRYRRKGAALDDILDAMVLAVTAQLANSKIFTLPQIPKRDNKGLPMEIVYAQP
jgi:predicted RNase H-like nuclease